MLSSYSLSFRFGVLSFPEFVSDISIRGRWRFWRLDSYGRLPWGRCGGVGGKERPAFGDGEGSRRMEQMNRQGRESSVASHRRTVSVGAGGSSGRGDVALPPRRYCLLLYHCTTELYPVLQVANGNCFVVPSPLTLKTGIQVYKDNRLVSLVA